MLRIVKNSFSLTDKKSLVCVSKFANQATSVTQTDEEYSKAIPYDKLPGPGILGLVVGSLPGGFKLDL